MNNKPKNSTFEALDWYSSMEVDDVTANDLSHPGFHIKSHAGLDPASRKSPGILSQAQDDLDYRFLT